MNETRSEFLQKLGWTPFFQNQLTTEELELAPLRVDAVHRKRITALAKTGQIDIDLPVHTNSGDFAVGDWVLADPVSFLLHRQLERSTLLQRGAEGKKPVQLVAANVDTLFIVTSCTAEFNVARLERYLAFANEAGTRAVIVLTKADLAQDAEEFGQRAAALQRGVAVVPLNARLAEATKALDPWCGPGSTVALVGSSGVGKSTLVNTLVGISRGQPQQTGSVRKSDSKGRHTTTSRSMHAMARGGWVIDTPGVRSLQLRDVEQGLGMLFAEITELAPHCKFRNCSHDHEPGCAVLAAVAQCKLDPERLGRWRKLQGESRGHSV
jgi:ribosome biogenesis GTPase